ncbi:hypothetical protein PO909_007681 [Leuciscus waleckii]
MENDSPSSSGDTGYNYPPVCECATGKECRLRAALDSMFKDHFRGQMVGLMHRIIDAACDMKKDCAQDTKRVTNLKNEMDVVRGLTKPWPDVTPMFFNGKEPIGVILRKVLDVLRECSDKFEITEILAIWTFVTDLCVSLVSKNAKTDVGELVESLVNYTLEQNMIACRDFLFWLDHL